MSSSAGVFSQTLQEITTTKLQELAKKRVSFEKSRAAVIAEADSQDDSIKMLTALSEGTQACLGIWKTAYGQMVDRSSRSPKLETDLRNLNRFVDQARFDPSISAKVIQQWRQSLINHLDVQSLKYQYADLYGQLTVEWLTSSQSNGKRARSAEFAQIDADDVDDFEEVSVKAKLDARQKWESSVFKADSVDAEVVGNFLDKLFEGEDAQKALNTLRVGITAIESDLTRRTQFNDYTLTWVIKGLLASDLLTNEKRSVLRDFLSNGTILKELADVLNMRIAALDSWSWGSEVTVEARRQLNGRFNIYMHEDLLQAIFLQYIGSKWSSGLKRHLMHFVWNKELWNISRKEYSPIDRQRRNWYLPSESSDNYLDRTRALHYRAGYFVSQLLNSEDQDLKVEEGAEEADFMGFVQAAGIQPTKETTQQSAPAMRFRRSIAVTNYEDASDEDMGFGLFDGEDTDPPDLDDYRPANPMDAKQKLLHLLSTEILVKTRVSGEITAFRSQFDSWYSSLPHTTIKTVLTYLGVSPMWLSFFKKFLEAPLKFTDDDGPPRLRKRGTPDAHILSDFLSESVLFCLDFAINKQTGSDVLWRMKDDIWFWSSAHEKCVDAWKLINQFNKTMGISLDDTRSAGVRLRRQQGKLVSVKLDKSLPDGQIRWGMLHLDRETGRFTIDRSVVDKHIEELRRQLKEKEKSLFAWVQAYSTYASVFFTTNFGEPANCFGREHLDAMLGMHERVQRTLFQASADGSTTSVVDWLKAQIEQRFGISDVPDGYLFFPTELGGLDVKSPFISLLQFRDSVTKDPNALLDEFEKAERTTYAEHKKRYLDKQPWLYPSKPNKHRPENPEEFMSFDEYIKFREQVQYGFPNELVNVYEELLRRPKEQPLDIHGNFELSEALQSHYILKSGSESISEWGSMEPYWKWVTMLYGPEILERFGGLNIVEPGLLPMGMVSMFRSGRVSWQE